MAIHLTSTSTVSANEHVVSCELDDGAALLDMEKNVYYGLNPVAAEVWSVMKTPSSVATIVDVLCEKFEADRSEVERDVVALLEEMYSAGLIDDECAKAL